MHAIIVSLGQKEYDLFKGAICKKWPDILFQAFKNDIVNVARRKDNTDIMSNMSCVNVLCCFVLCCVRYVMKLAR